MNEELSKQVCQVMKLINSKVSPDNGTAGTRLDSLMALELRNTVSAIAGQPAATLLSDYPIHCALRFPASVQLFQTTIDRVRLLLRRSKMVGF